MDSSGGSTVVSPSSTEKIQSPVFRTVKTVSPAVLGGRYHPWEELDELEYVAGDEERHVKAKATISEP